MRLTSVTVSRQLAQMLRAFSLTLRQLGDPAIFRVLAKSLALTVLIFVLSGAGLVQAAEALAAYYGWGADGGFAAATAAALAALAAAWLLFRAVAVPVISLFADDVVAAIERRHYPAAAASVCHVGIGQSLAMVAGSLVRLIGLNLLALPGYVILLVTGIGPFILFFAVNALLLGRDLGEMVAARHLDRADRKIWLRTPRGERTIMGLIASGLFVIPFLNLLAPVMGAGMATHLYHGRKR